MQGEEAGPEEGEPQGATGLLTRAGTWEAVTLAGSDGVGTRPGSDGADAREARRVTRASSRVCSPEPGSCAPTHLPPPRGSGPQPPTSRVNRRMDRTFMRRNFSQQCAEKKQVTE